MTIYGWTYNANRDVYETKRGCRIIEWPGHLFRKFYGI